ncbi:unnamed protein product [Caenorhabditis nigoni]
MDVWRALLHAILEVTTFLASASTSRRCIQTTAVLSELTPLRRARRFGQSSPQPQASEHSTAIHGVLYWYFDTLRRLSVLCWRWRTPLDPFSVAL